jgi:hypothetical protein
MKTCHRGHVREDHVPKCCECGRMSKTDRRRKRLLPPFCHTELAKDRGLQRLVRIPAIRPGDFVTLGNGRTPEDLQGKRVEVKSMAFTITARGQRWHVITIDGRSLEVGMVERVEVPK